MVCPCQQQGRRPWHQCQQRGRGRSRPVNPRKNQNAETNAWGPKCTDAFSAGWWLVGTLNLVAACGVVGGLPRSLSPSRGLIVRVMGIWLGWRPKQSVTTRPAVPALSAGPRGRHTEPVLPACGGLRVIRVGQILSRPMTWKLSALVCLAFGPDLMGCLVLGCATGERGARGCLVCAGWLRGTCATAPSAWNL